MIIKKKMVDLPAFTAGDATTIREVLHPKNEALPITYSLAHASLEPGASSYPHLLENQNELYIFLSGSGKVFIGEESTEVAQGDITLVPAGQKQYVQNTGVEKLVFLCVVDPPWTKDDEVILED